MQVEPRYLRPAGLDVCRRDPFAAKIPDDHEAEAWWEEQLDHYQKRVSMEAALGGRPFGPSRPT